MKTVAMPLGAVAVVLATILAGSGCGDSTAPQLMEPAATPV